MKGIYGIGLLALGIFLAVLGGFVFNAETVTTVNTDWDYVTDIGGAFQGDDSDMDVQYDPTENMTGWSAFDEPNGGWISGVQPEYTDSINLFRVSTGERSYTSYVIGWNADDHTGNVTDPQFRLSLGSDRYLGTMASGFGLYNPESVTAFVKGSTTYYGSFAAPLSAVASIVPDFYGLDSITISIVSSSNGYPCFAKVEQQIGRAQIVHSGSTYNPIVTTSTAKVSSTTVIIDVTTGSASIDGTKIPLSEAVIVWGQAQFDGSGDFTHYCSTRGTGTLEGETKYLDAASGFLVSAGTVSWSDMEYTSHSGSSSPTMDITFVADDSEDVCSGTISYIADGSSTSVEAATFTYAGGPSSSRTAVTPSGGSEYVGTSGEGSASLTMSMSGGVMTFYVDGTEAGTFTASSTISSLTITWAPLSADMPSYTAVVTRDDGTSASFEGEDEQTFTADLSYVSYSPTPHEESYSTTYWYNGQDNAEITVAVRAIAWPTSVSILFRGPDGQTAVEVAYSSSTGYTVGGVNVGSWEGVEVTVGYGKVTATPISSFRSFLDYKTVSSPRSIIDSGAVGGGIVESMAVSAGSVGVYMMKMCVVSTTARIYDGGLFLQDASMDLNAMFPESEAVSVMIGSAAKMGDSITFTSGSSSATMLVDSAAQTIQIGDKWFPFNGVTFRWYSSSGPSATVDGQTFGAAIYLNGSTYDAGKIWAETRGGNMTEVLDASEGWTMTLDGVWAPSVFLYEGENTASSTTELADWSDAIFKWNKNDFVLVLMAVSVLGGVVGSYYKWMDMWDWAAIIGTVAVLWILL